MKNAFAPRLLALLLLLTACAAALHLACASGIAPGVVEVEAGGRSLSLALADLPAAPVEGETVNGRGERRTIQGSGVELTALLERAGVDPSAVPGVTVLAADGYSARIGGEELRESGRVFLLLREEGLPRLVVFGDPDSRRAVRDVVRVAADGPDAGTPAP